MDEFDRLITEFALDKPTNLIVAGISFAIGYVQYLYAVQLVLREGKGPLPFWMHLFYLAHDSSWSYICGCAAPLYGDAWFLRGVSTALGLWATLEVFCIYKAITVERVEIFGPLFGKNAQLSQILCYTAVMQAAMYLIVWLFISFVGGDCLFQWFAYTNVLIIVGPTNLWLSRQSRDGLSLGLALTNICCAIFTFAPFSMWVRAIPEVFDRSVYYCTGVVMLVYSIYMCLIVSGYPEKQRGKSGQAPIW